jgi:hypothetical protein
MILMNDKTDKIYKHIAVRQDTYDLFLKEAKYRDTQDAILSRILKEREQQRKGDLIIS